MTPAAPPPPPPPQPNLNQPEAPKVAAAGNPFDDLFDDKANAPPPQGAAASSNPFDF